MKTMMMLAAALAISTTAIADDKKSADKKEMPPPPAMPIPKPSQEVADMAKAMAGTWKCTGKGLMDPSKPTEWTDIKGSYKAALDMDKFFIKGEWTGTMKMGGKDITAKGIIYTTYDAAAKKWNRVGVDNSGSVSMDSSTGMKDGKMVWEGEGRGMGMTIKNRSTEEMKDKDFKMTGEMSMDGKKWVQGFEMTCKKG